MEARSLPEALTLIMEERGWTQDELARALGVSQPWISKMITGTRDTQIGKALHLLGKVGWEGVYRPKREEVDPVKRRELFNKGAQLAGVAFVEKAAGVLFVPSPKVGPYQDAEYLRGLALHLGQTNEQFGGVPLVSRALLHVDRVKEAINSRNRELQMAASDLTRKASLVLYDARRFKEANDVGVSALTLARRADFDEGIAHCYENLSFFNVGRDPSLGAHYAQTGLKYPGLTDEHRARLTARFSSALTRAKPNRAREYASRSALDDARSTSGLSTNTNAVILGCVGDSLARLKYYDDADAAFSHAIQGFAASPALQATWMASQINYSLNAAQPSRAADQMRTLARIVPLVSSARLNRKLPEIMTLSEQWETVREVRDARDQLRGVMPPGASGTR